MGDPETLRKYAAALGASGVGLGAFGAHALKSTLAKKSGGADNWKTAVSINFCMLLHCYHYLVSMRVDRRSIKIAEAVVCQVEN
jgi:uncharacterized membrane protein YgdD (TMEM256/DUF423 family)